MASSLERMINDFEQCEHPNYVLLTSTDLISLREVWPEEFIQDVYIEGAWGKQCSVCNKIFEIDDSLHQVKKGINKISAVLNQGNFSIHFGKGDRRLNLIKKGSSKTSISNNVTRESFAASPSRYKLSEDIILPQETLSIIEDALVKLQYRDLIYEDWGFKKVDPLGNGAVFNFYGPPGTGKTRTAEALAGELGMPFLNVDYGNLVSKYHGDTPKNIERAFENAKRQEALLFFDEADTVLSKRAKTIGQALDQETNLSKSTFLKQLEIFDGVCVFATNEPAMYDDAFKRRLAFDVEFKLPDFEMRKKIWSLHIVEGIPLADDREDIINSAAEASESFSGGDILKAMRQALPKAIVKNPENPKLSKNHLIEAITKIISDNKGKQSELSERQEISKSLLNL